jgi:hypothetical protein
VLRSCEHCSEILGSIKCGECIEYVRICWPVKEERLVVACVDGGVTWWKGCGLLWRVDDGVTWWKNCGLLWRVWMMV